VAALAYVLPPVSGLLVYLFGSTIRARRHGLQGVVLGVLWPAALYAGALVSPGATQGAALVGAVAWLTLLAGTAAGRDPALPGAGRLLQAWAQTSPRAR
jgi:hypothetical protein